MPLKDLQKGLKEKKKIIFGSVRNLKLAKLGRVKEVFLASNCSSSVEERLASYTSFSPIKVEALASTSEELALACGKPFPVTVVGFAQA